MTITYNKVLDLYESSIYNETVCGESVAECIENAVRIINWYRVRAGLSKILV